MIHGSINYYSIRVVILVVGNALCSASSLAHAPTTEFNPSNTENDPLADCNVGNGCGPGGEDFCETWVKPRWGEGYRYETCQRYRKIFQTACNAHDVCYAECCCNPSDIRCKKIRQMYCDLKFYGDMLRACRGFYGIQRDECNIVASIFFVAVSAKGLPYVNCECRVGCPPTGDGGSRPTMERLGLAINTHAESFIENTDESYDNPALDEDQDGVPDQFEVLVGMDPTDATDAIADPDQDGIPSAMEVLLGIHPFMKDSNNDGRNDRAEMMRWIKKHDRLHERGVRRE